MKFCSNAWNARGRRMFYEYRWPRAIKVTKQWKEPEGGWRRKLPELMQALQAARTGMSPVRQR